MSHYAERVNGPPRFTPESLAPWLEFRFDRGGGPGGQHVNKVSTRATLLFDFRSCTLLDPLEIARIATRTRERRATDGRIRIVAQGDRSQAANRADATQRLIDLLGRWLHVDPPRRPTRPSAGAKRRRLADKKHRSELKSRRRQGPPRDP